MFYTPLSNVSYNRFDTRNDEGEVIGSESPPTFEIDGEQAIIDWYISSHPEMVAERFQILGAPEDRAFSMIVQYEEEDLGILRDSDINLGLDHDFDQQRGNILNTRNSIETAPDSIETKQPL